MPYPENNGGAEGGFNALLTLWMPFVRFSWTGVCAVSAAVGNTQKEDPLSARRRHGSVSRMMMIENTNVFDIVEIY